MPVSNEYLDYVQDLLSVLGPVTAKRMFGGAGLYHKGLFFALVADDVLYFKVDDSTRGDFDAAAMEPFRPYGDEGYAMQYYEVPVDVLEDRDQLAAWAEKAIGVAARKRVPASGKKSRKKK
ncbi:MAG: competence protein TfoX [Nitrospirae bacterium GWC2_57_13]|jgi:DNA transformation protein and related proteins|nr:MAG: competence protein TfoX [Nitrospirae bacterium GWC1_57_7]OGW29146.1 MAG: competence protein TfoX [Nitrospirae bacterium GWC2_57_13]OGW45117.1 MAG: competence protein TfoX [Nitrospirae bacterium GWD2_57_8]HAR45138.1 competence protein TfoX [Nitrospiraceae bacterium]HAS52854.1 competence protein TfoX [Nitrospiraceae bacterium]